MVSWIRRRLTYANVAMTLALVFAMTGGAYAANRYIITSTAQIKPKVLAELKGKAGANGAQGPAGPAGPQGTAGAAGAKGETGLAGTNGEKGEPGTPGKNGENVTAKAVPTKVATCAGQGGAEYTVGGKTTPICNGQTGFTETLPSGKTLTGEWNLSGQVSIGFAEGGGDSLEEEQAISSVSFNIPLAEAPTPIYIKELEKTPTGCLGNVEKPGAEPGNLCVFARQEINDTKEVPRPIICAFAEDGNCNLGSASADRIGFGLATIAEKKGWVQNEGSWAVTAK